MPSLCKEEICIASIYWFLYFHTFLCSLIVLGVSYALVSLFSCTIALCMELLNKHRPKNWVTSFLFSFFLINTNCYSIKNAVHQVVLHLYKAASICFSVRGRAGVLLISISLSEQSFALFFQSLEKKKASSPSRGFHGTFCSIVLDCIEIIIVTNKKTTTKISLIYSYFPVSLYLQIGFVEFKLMLRFSFKIFDPMKII